MRGEIEGGERESRELEWKGEGRFRKSLWWSREVIRRDWIFEELKGMVEEGFGYLPMFL